MTRAGCLLILSFLSACVADAPTITGKEWQVAAVNDIVNPVGAGGRPLTMTFDDSTHRVYGFAGCNRYNASYTLKGDSLTFGMGISTRMACQGADSLEMIFLQALPKVRQYSRSDSLLILSGEGTAIRLR